MECKLECRRYPTQLEEVTRSACSTGCPKVAAYKQKRFWIMLLTQSNSLVERPYSLKNASC